MQAGTEVQTLFDLIGNGGGRLRIGLSFEFGLPGGCLFLFDFFFESYLFRVGLQPLAHRVGCGGNLGQGNVEGLGWLQTNAVLLVDTLGKGGLEFSGLCQCRLETLTGVR